ncbi:GNAT family N-acetyltransferase [Actinocrispum wychmicini]|uniref:Putative acetyltransferase n=1 Tax=Actinocrispum wychmicini TaxID=1213861 RepID=A0A4V2S5V0_9PSEU|nr:GNAT family N-acetyltransferase [Actinocrispum wychmicini]TCO53550.1 putative acetyltransferase [Actinocrispum wychmicini]
MTDFDVRVLAPDQLREAQTLVRRALFNTAPTDEEWAGLTFAPDRYLGAVSDGSVVGTTYTFPSSIAVPGGNVVPMSAVSRVGVRADHRRRGILTELMRLQFADARQHGESIATLHASETSIYSRFGYGISTFASELTVRRGSLRPEVPKAGHVRLLDADEAIKTLPGLYERIGLHRPGMMSRGADWWPTFGRWKNPWVVVHTGPAGDDGFVVYTNEPMANADNPDHDNRLVVVDMHAANPAATNGMWRYLLGVDLVGEIQAHSLPTDNPVGLLLADPRKCRGNVADELWVRLVDVPDALAARSYGDADPVVIQVEDRFLPENSGTYGIASSGAVRVTGQPALVMDVDSLAMIYFGSVRPSALADAGRVRVVDADSVARADKLFACEQIAWCGTPF